LLPAPLRWSASAAKADAVNLTSAQQTSLKNDINGRAAVSALVAIQNWPAIATFYNGVAAPTVNVWLTNVPEKTIKAGVQWTAFAGLSAQLQNTYLAIVNDGTVDATDKGTMRGLVGMWQESPATSGVFVDATASSTNIRALCIRAATYLEALFSALGAGTLVTSNVCSLDALGNSILGQRLTDLDVYHAMTGQ
jgi:hypothetical protein